ncbi:MAG: hypothetical protein V4584_05425 [Verrucomicrobiota bacterium]
MDSIFFIPSLFVLMLVLAWRFAIHRSSLGIRGWLVPGSLVLVVSVSLPLAMGVWLPDIFGKQQTLSSATTSSGHRISIVQYWNHVDFYTTEARVTGPDGVTSVSIIDGDAAKSWGAGLEVEPSQKGATYRLPDGRTGTITW